MVKTTKEKDSSCLKTMVVNLLLVGVLVHGVVSNEHQETCLDGDDTCRNSYIDQCQLYLAQSSIPNAGIGVYTSVDYKEGDYIGENDFIIPLSNTPENDEWLIDDVEWSVNLDPRLVYDANPSKMSLFVPGFGAQVNCHFGLNNAYHGKPEYDSGGLHRSKDPGAGAFTYWQNMPNYATRDISAGEELFVDYGHGWFDTRTYWMGEIPKEDDFARADILVRNFHSINAKYYNEARTDLTVLNNSLALEDLWSMVRNWTSSEALLRALPQRYAGIEEAVAHGVARHSIGGVSSIRSKEWLNENGICLDNLYINISTIPQAGRGAFAKRFLPSGSVISPVPVLQIHRGHFFSEQTGFQLLYNYVFGHPESEIFLLSYSSTVNFINHNSQNPNVKLRWSNSTLHRKHFLDLSSEDVLKQGFGLFMEFVALRDIQPHEEILFDYGVEWETAWKEHVEGWRPVPGSENYTAANDAIKMIGILTLEEQKENSYPENVHTACYFAHTQNTVYKNVTGDGDIPTYTADWEEKNYDCLRWCSILDRTTINGSSHIFYNVLLDQYDHFDSDCRMSNGEKIFVHNVPSEAVTLMDVEWSRDQHLPNAFRHYIGLPDELYPVQWRLNKVTNYTKQHSDQCQLYLAESSIPNSGIGVFTADDIKKGQFVGERELLIPLTDSSFEHLWLLKDVTWDLSLSPFLYYESNVKQVFYPGFGAQANCHFGLNNVEHDKPKFDSAGLHRSKDPGVGAFTYWYDMPHIASRDIQSGEELLVDYGNYEWFDLRQDFLGVIPREDDYIAADHIVQKTHSLFRKHYTGMAEDEASALKDLWNVTRNVSSPALQRALPERYEEVDEVINFGTARHSVGGPSSLRSREWLHKNGICIDNMYVNISTIPQAGRGAFAKRFLPKDTIVSPVPVLQVHRGSLLYEPTGFQLLINYAFGHPDSPVFLIPYSATVNFINHDSKNPNVKLRWSTSSLHRKDFLDLSSEKVLYAGFGLLMEFVALRDIEPNEEILFHYGDEWERAWLKHVETWEPQPGSENYISASTATETIGILTVEEQRLKPYPENLQTACFFYQTHDTVYYKSDHEEVNVKRVTWNEKNRDCLRWCSILERKVVGNGSVYYDALLLPQDSNLHEDCIMSSHEKIYVDSIPSEAVSLVDQNLSGDNFLPNVFRHYIQLSDDLYPATWINRAESSDS
jgi:hypothetical protein